MEPSFDDRFDNNLPDYVNLTPVDYDPFGRAAQRTRAHYDKANQRTSGLPDVLSVIGNRVQSGLTAPLDALTGQLQVNDPETNMPTQQAMGRAVDVTALAGGGSPFGTGSGSGFSLGMVPVDVAKRLNVKKSIPSDVLKQAAENTPGASVDPEGALIVKVHRNQKPDQELEESVRNGVFYLPSTRNAHYYKRATNDFKKNTYGGSQNIQGETAYLNPLVVKGATGGKAPEMAYEQLNGKGSFKNMHDDAMQAVLWHDKAGRIGPSQEEMVSNFFEKHAPEMIGKEWQILENSKHGNQLQYALKEAAVAHAAREAGHDGVIGYSVGKDKKPFLSEVFDVRETHYPGTQGEYELHPKFLPNNPELKGSAGGKLLNKDHPFTETAYHGSGRPFEGDKIITGPKSSKEGDTSHFYSTSEPDKASNFAGKPMEYDWGTNSPHVMPLKINTENYHVVDAKHKNWHDINQSVIDEAKKLNKDGVVVKNVNEGDGTFHKKIFITFNPSTVRSQFAQFAPENVGKSGLFLQSGLPFNFVPIDGDPFEKKK